MNTIKLSPEKKQFLENCYSSCNSRKEGDRIKAVLLRSKGWTVSMISQALRLHETTVARHLNDYRQGKLTLASGGSKSSLDEKQTAELISHLEKTTYSTTQEIISYVSAKYNVLYSVPGMNKWLHRHGFSYKKPKGYPYKACKEQQKNFIELYKEFKKTLPTNESIYFMDSCHPSIATKISYGWIKKGTDKPIKTTASRTRMNLVGALCLEELANPLISSYSITHP